MSTLPPLQLAALNEFGEANAWADYYRCAPAEFARKFRVEAKRLGSVWVTMIPELDWTFFNRIVGLGIGAPATEAMLDDAIALLQKAGCKNYMAQVSPLAQPAGLAGWLERREFVRGRNWAKVYRGDEPAPTASTSLRVEAIGAEYASAFSEIVQTTFEIPPELRPMVSGIIGKPGWYPFLAFDGEQPVSAAALNVSGGVGWLGFATTLESHRKRGGQSALFARRIEAGLDLGCKWFVVETGEDTPEAPNPSYRNMIRAGFKLAYLRPNYVHETPAG